MRYGLKGRVAIVTAASRGIGLGVARVLGREGMRLIISSRDRERLAEAQRELRGEGIEVETVVADITVRSDVRRIVDVAVGRYGTVDVLVYNTGPPKPGTFMELSDEDWEYGVRLLLMSAIWITRDVVDHMIRKRSGNIIYITSSTLKQPIPSLTLSNVVRLSIAGLVKTLAHQLGPYNIRVNGILQGYVDTERLREVASDRARREGKAVDQVLLELASQIPIGRLGRPEDVGELAAFLASDTASYISGSLIGIDGGMVLCL